MMGTRSGLLLGLILTGTLQAATPDPDDMAALLSDLEASGGVLTQAEIAGLSSGPRPPATGGFFLGYGRRLDGATRLDALLERRGSLLSGRMRWRRDQGGDLVGGWLQVQSGAWQPEGGGGSVRHGFGLLSAPIGARQSLSPESTLLPRTPGWRPSTALTAANGQVGLALDGRLGGQQFLVAVSRDDLGQTTECARVGLVATGSHLGFMGLKRGQSQGQSLDARWERGPWRVVGEGARWRLDPAGAWQGAWALVVGWSDRRWRAEIQGAATEAAAPLTGALRPACLGSWQAQGWAARLSGRPGSGMHLGMSWCGDRSRDPDRVDRGPLERQQLAVAVSGRWSWGGHWEVRLRRAQHRQRSWDPDQPWLPAAVTSDRLRHWLLLQAELPTERGEVRVSWRRLEEGTEARNLSSIRWQQMLGTVQIRLGLQSAWGDPLDLVSVSAPVRGLIRLRHWGSWDSGILMGIQGQGAWQWELGGEVRRSTLGDLDAEMRASWGRRF